MFKIVGCFYPTILLYKPINNWMSPITPLELIESTTERLRRKKIELPFLVVLPRNFQTIESFLIGRVYANKLLVVIASVCVEDDGLLWYHVSFSKKDKTIPTYADLQFVKEFWIGDNNWCIQVFLEKDKHVNLVNALHLWHCLEGNPIPDFRKFGQI